MQRLGLGVFPLVEEGIGQEAVAVGGVGVSLAPDLEVQRQGAAVHRLGVGVLPLGAEGIGHVVVAPAGFIVVLTQRLQEDGQCLEVVRLGLGVPSLPFHVVRDVPVVISGGRVVFAQRAEGDGERLAEEGFGLDRLPLTAQVDREALVAPDGTGVVFAQPALTDRERTATEPVRFGVPGGLAGGDGLATDLLHRRHRLAAVLGQGGDLAQVVRGAAGVGRLPVVGALEADADLRRLAGGVDGLGKPALAPELGDLLLQLLDPCQGLAGHLGQRFQGAMAATWLGSGCASLAVVWARPAVYVVEISSKVGASLMGELHDSIKLSGFLRFLRRLDREGHRPNRLDAAAGPKGTAGGLDRLREIGQATGIPSDDLSCELTSVEFPDGVDRGWLPWEVAQ